MSRVEREALSIERDGSALRLSGRLDIDSAPALLEQALPMLKRLERVELGGLSDIDSAGVASLRLLQRWATDAGSTLSLQQPPPRFAAICAAHRLDPGEWAGRN
ncbi:MAG: STAS domain-containing protein [Aquimonas sp.]|nr:STAS domain-containing protein [Aquimonas sp.]